MQETSLKLHPDSLVGDGSSVEGDNMAQITVPSVVDCAGDAEEGNYIVD